MLRTCSNKGQPTLSCVYSQAIPMPPVDAEALYALLVATYIILHALLLG